VIAWLVLDAGNRRPPTTPLMQAVSPPLCKVTGASTLNALHRTGALDAEPHRDAARDEGVLVGPRAGDAIEHGVLLRMEACVDLVLRQLLTTAGVLREVEAHGLGP
jgi:hypothetical protein